MENNKSSILGAVLFGASVMGVIGESMYILGHANSSTQSFTSYAALGALVGVFHALFLGHHLAMRRRCFMAYCLLAVILTFIGSYLWGALIRVLYFWFGTQRAVTFTDLLSANLLRGSLWATALGSGYAIYFSIIKKKQNNEKQQAS